jgi:alkylhydroperoxidase/carboxymuconolactone decarboxylase family protein YurZ
VQYTTDVLFRDLWLRPDLAPRDRSLVTVSALIANGQAAQISFHLNRAMDNGLLQTEAAEALTHLAFYAGWPNVFSALPVAKDVFEKASSLTVRPYIICHMLSSVDGKIDGASLQGLTPAGEYEATGAQLNGDAWICGRTTMQQHFADPEPFVPTSPARPGHSRCTSPGTPSPTPLRSTRRASCDGRALISTVITSSPL